MRTSTTKWICFHVKNRTKVYEEWVFEYQYSALESQLYLKESGTGKTMAAEALAMITVLTFCESIYQP
jgi:hypothetical protein